MHISSSSYTFHIAWLSPSFCESLRAARASCYIVDGITDYGVRSLHTGVLQQRQVKQIASRERAAGGRNAGNVDWHLSGNICQLSLCHIHSPYDRARRYLREFIVYGCASGEARHRCSIHTHFYTQVPHYTTKVRLIRLSPRRAGDDIYCLIESARTCADTVKRVLYDGCCTPFIVLPSIVFNFQLGN